MYERDCILALTQGARVQAAPHMHFDSSNGSRSYTTTRGPSATRHKRAVDQSARSHRHTHQIRRISSFQMICGTRLCESKSKRTTQVSKSDGARGASWLERGIGDWKQNLRQSPMPNSTLHHCSKLRDHRTPARRQSGRRRFDHLPPPRACLCG